MGGTRSEGRHPESHPYRGQRPRRPVPQPCSMTASVNSPGTQAQSPGRNLEMQDSSRYKVGRDTWSVKIQGGTSRNKIEQCYRGDEHIQPNIVPSHWGTRRQKEGEHGRDKSSSLSPFWLSLKGGDHGVTGG